jgi:hypothetical protein
LLQRIPAGQVKIGARMIARSHDEIHRLLIDIGFPAVEPRLPAPLVIFAVPLDHRKVRAGRLVIKALPRREILDRVGRRQPVERPPHAGLPEVGRQLRVAARAQCRVHVPVAGCGGS